MLNKIHHEASGQVALYQTDDRYFALLDQRFGPRFREYRRLWAERGRRGPAGDFPLSLDLAVNSGCQLHCLMCPLPGRSRDRAVRLMDEGLFQRLMDEARERRLAALTFGLASEPLLHPRLAGLVESAVRAEVMDTRLGTNGLLLTRPLMERLVGSGLSRLEISVDAARPETYAALRQGGRLEVLEKIIGEFLEIRGRAGQSWPLLRLSFLKLPQNADELAPFLAKWSGLADLVSIQEVIWFPDSRLPRPERPGRPQAPTCAQGWQRLAVDADGRAWPCCSWFGATLLPLNLNNLSVAEVWSSREMEALRRGLTAGQAPAPCRRCQF